MFSCYETMLIIISIVLFPNVILKLEPRNQSSVVTTANGLIREDNVCFILHYDSVALPTS